MVKHNKREKTVEKFRALREELREKMKSVSHPAEERMAARRKLNQLPRYSMETRLNSRCQISGNPRAVLRKFAMSRMAFRKLASQGLIPGVTKASW
jgi:small subunit ribosomal protein S14